MAVYGLDLSVHNGSVDFGAIKAAGHDFVILRAGYGSSISQKDTKFEEYYKAAKAAGLKVGAYWYSYALSAAEGTAEAKTFLEAIKGKTFEYPVYIDMEDADAYKRKHGMPSNATLCAICENFCKYVEDRGYYVGVYASESWFNSQLKNMSKAYDRWVANWGSNNGKLQSDKSGTYHLHQYTSEYRISGVGKRYDKNVAYVDYPSIIKSKGLNGFSKESNNVSKPTSTAPSGTTLELVVGVMQNKYGIGDERKKKLGARYDEVQDMINHIASASVDTLVKEVKAGKYGNDKIRKTALGDRYDEVQAKINAGSINKPKIRKGAKVKYTGYVYADSNGNGKGAKVSGTYTVTIYNSNAYGAHLDGLGWVKPGNCTVIG